MSKKNRRKTNSSVADKYSPQSDYNIEDDIYNRAKKVPFFEYEKAIGIQQEGYRNLADDLDIPGSELDDVDEVIGEEDEENNYYSLGGDDHDDLEENKPSCSDPRKC